MELVYVEDAVLHTAEFAIAEKIVLFVRVQWTGHYIPEQGLSIAGPKQINYVLSHIRRKEPPEFFIMKDDVTSN